MVAVAAADPMLFERPDDHGAGTVACSHDHKRCWSRRAWQSSTNWPYRWPLAGGTVPISIAPCGPSSLQS